MREIIQQSRQFAIETPKEDDQLKAHLEYKNYKLVPMQGYFEIRNYDGKNHGTYTNNKEGENRLMVVKGTRLEWTINEFLKTHPPREEEPATAEEAEK